MNRPGAPLLSAEQHELAATARPWAENLLHTHADQRGRRDVVGLGTSLAGATLRFGDSEPGFGTATTYTFGTLLRAGDRTQHLVSNLIVTARDPANRHGEGSGTRHHLCGVHPMYPGIRHRHLVGVAAHLPESAIDGGHWKFTAQKVRRDWFLEPQR